MLDSYRGGHEMTKVLDQLTAFRLPVVYQRPGKVIVVPLMVIATELVESTSAGTATAEVAAAASPVHPPPLGFSALVCTVMVCLVPLTESGSSGQPELPQVTIRSCPGPPQAAVTRKAEAPASVVGTVMSAAMPVVHEITGEALVGDGEHAPAASRQVSIATVGGNNSSTLRRFTRDHHL